MSELTEQLQAQYVAALERERAVYLAAGKHERADQVTAELQRVGAAPKPAKPKRTRPATA